MGWKYKNSTDIPDRTLRALIRWIMRELEIPRTELREIEVRNRSYGAYSGVCYTRQRRIVASLGPARAYPVKPKESEVRPVDRVEGLVVILSHELYHLRQYVRGILQKAIEERDLENQANAAERRMLLAFRLVREDFSRRYPFHGEPKPVDRTKRRSLRELKARLCLERWEARLRHARAEVRRYRAAVRRYERLRAASSRVVLDEVEDPVETG